jgi:hypothetical protein
LSKEEEPLSSRKTGGKSRGKIPGEAIFSRQKGPVSYSKQILVNYLQVFLIKYLLTLGKKGRMRAAK